MIRVATIIFAAMLASFAAPPAVAAEESLVLAAASGDPYAPAVGRMVQSMVEYTRWTSPPNPVELCISGPADHASRLDGLRLSDGRAIVRRSISASPLALAGCDVLYLGRLPASAARGLTDAARGKGVLTIAESDPDGRSQAMFVLVFRPGALTFRLNIDAVSRSGLRVDPRVLRLAQGG
ncbi:YfiR family protein [Novosphingobium sp. B 225]|uniref:YfiR family protein n=1 Tax=Novosphingobium sp. B 225 TaxID=1961849 RepID=UPI0015952DCE|nr:YfiR family protein [Novosphingobium sp. B 225]